MNTTRPVRTNPSNGARVGAIIAFIVLAYWPSLDVPFVFDDFHNIVTNDAVHPERWSELVAPFQEERGVRSRPFGKFTFAVNYLADGLNPTGYHLVNIAIHIVNAVLLYALLLALTRAPRSPPALARNAALFAFGAALIWALHPVNTQAVTYVVQRLASLAATFYLLAMLLFVLWRTGRVRTPIAWAGIAASFVLGFLTKEHTVTLPAALLLVDVAFFAGWRRRHSILVAALAVAAIPLLITYGHATLEYLTEPSPRRGFSALERLMTQGRVIAHYLSLIVWPDHGRLQVDYDFAVSRGLLQPPVTVLAWAALAAVTFAAAVGLRRQPWLCAGWLFFMLAIAVESSIVMIELAFEHRVYLPSLLLVAGILAPAYSHATSPRAARGLALVAIAVAGLLAFQTVERNREWVDQGELWKADMKRGASQFRSALNSAYALVRQGRPDEALDILERVPKNLEGLSAAKIEKNRGDILFMLGRYERALEAFTRSLEQVKADPRAAYSVGTTLVQLDRLEDARKMLEQLRETLPDSSYTVLLEAEIRAADGAPGKALRRLRQVAAEREGSWSPQTINAVRFHIAHLERRLGRHEAAARQYRAIVDSDPKNWNAWAHLYHMLRAGGSEAEAAKIRRYLDRHGVDPAAWAPGRDSDTGPAYRPVADSPG